MKAMENNICNIKGPSFYRNCSPSQMFFKKNSEHLFHKNTAIGYCCNPVGIYLFKVRRKNVKMMPTVLKKQL